MKLRYIIPRVMMFMAMLSSLLLISACTDDSSERRDEVIEVVKVDRTNILLIVADDLGYSDLGAYGGEINTPNLDKLAQSGVQLTKFYVAPNCSPTRAMLLSGTDNHIAGLGTMAEAKARTKQYDNVPGYEGYLNAQVVTLPELLRDAGYHTYMAGKWHLGKSSSQSPAARGFEKSFSLLNGGASHFDLTGIGMHEQVALYREDFEEVKELPKDFYSSRFYTKRMIDYIDSQREDGKPFFGYLAYTAPHWPLMAPDESIKKYKGQYSEGYQIIQQKRLKKMKALGLINNDTQANVKLPSWEQLSKEEQTKEARAMEIYAAMVDDMDHYIGQLMNYLDSINERENTLIVFLSDNGAEGHDLSLLPPFAKWANKCCDNSLDNMGKAGSYVWYGPAWGTVSSTPLGGYKGSPMQGV